MLNFGYVSNIDNNARVRVVIPDMDNYETGFLPVLRQKSKEDKDGTILDINEEVAVILTQNGDKGVVLGAVSTDMTLLPLVDRNKKYYQFKDGTNIEYDRQTHNLSADIKGSIKFKAQKSIDFEAQKISLGKDGKQIARIGDSVQVDLTTGKGTITSGGVNTSA